jgi:streptogramin lyase
VTRIDPASGQVWRYELGAVVGGLEIAAGREGVFVIENANNGTVAQLDQRSPRVLRVFSGRNLRQLVVGGGSLWTGSCGGSVIRIDPSTLHEIATIPVIHGPGPPDYKCQDPVLFAQHALWVLTGQHRLSRLDPKTQAITESVPVPFAYTEGSSQNVTSSPERIWATYSNELDGRIRIVGVDTRTGRVVVSRRGRNVSPSNDLNGLHARITAIAANRRYLWLAGPDSVLWLDPSTLRVMKTTKVSDPTGLVVVGDSLWVAEGRSRTGGVLQRISIGGADTRPTTSASEIVYADEGVVLSSPPSGYVPPVSAVDAQKSFDQQQVPHHFLGPLISSSTPTVDLKLVTEKHPTYPGLSPGAHYPAWVITYRSVPPVSYGPSPLSNAASMNCKFVGIFDLDIRAWTTFFQSCH